MTQAITADERLRLLAGRVALFVVRAWYTEERRTCDDTILETLLDEKAWA